MNERVARQDDKQRASGIMSFTPLVTPHSGYSFMRLQFLEREHLPKPHSTLITKGSALVRHLTLGWLSLLHTLPPPAFQRQLWDMPPCVKQRGME